MRSNFLILTIALLLSVTAVAKSENNLLIPPGVSWQPIEVLPSPSVGWSGFGRSIAVDGNVMAVGAPDFGSGNLQGSVYIFEKVGNNWVQQARVFASDGFSKDMFGRTVAVSGKTIIAGTWPNGPSPLNGAYVFKKINGFWIETQKVTKPGGSAWPNLFGTNVAIRNDTLAIGDWGDGGPFVSTYFSGAVYIYKDSGPTFELKQKLVANDRPNNKGFGYDIAIDGDLIAIGAYGDDDAGPMQGSVHVFKLNSGGVWEFESRIHADDGSNNDNFGSAVAISRDTLIASADSIFYGYDFYRGAAYIFRRGPNGWALEQKLSYHGSDAEKFAMDVAIKDNLILVGAPQAGPTYGGKVYFFERSGREWIRQSVYSGQSYTQQAGFSVAISEGTPVAGGLGEFGRAIVFRPRFSL